jgi:hypothetical protein
MIRLGDGVYLCFLNGHRLKIVYVGNNICKLYLENEYQGTAPFDYVKRKLTEMEKKWNTSNIHGYQFQELRSSIDQLI